MVWLFVVGACIGSFLNVCIYRLPREMCIVAPGSHCPACHAAIRWYHNLPILSYVFLGGRCAACQRPFSARYMFVELLTAASFVWLYYRFALVLHKPRAVFAVYALLTSALIAATFIDFDFRIIPNQITFTGIALAPLLSMLVPQIHGPSVRPLGGLVASLVGVAVSGVAVYCVGLMGKWIFRKEALGFGDVKLMALVGGVCGWQVAMIAFFVAPFFGLLMGIPSLLFKGKHAIPYGPFLSLATVLVLSWKTEFIRLASGQIFH